MVKPSIKYVFSDKIERIKCPRWYELLSQDQSTYANCELVTFTRVKNLDSDWKHEYVQFIVRDRDSGEKTRIYAERANETDLDYVTIGRDEKTFNAYPDMPLPLESLTFKPKLDGKNPSIVEIAKILSDVGTAGGKYELYGHSCFWFAYTTFTTIKACFTAEYKKWSWINSGGGDNIVENAWGLGFSTMFKFAFKGKAKDFKTDRRDNFTWDVTGPNREEVTPAEVVNHVVAQLDNPTSLQLYIDSINAMGIDADANSVKNVANGVVTHAEKVSQAPDLDWTKEFDNDVADFNEKVLSDESSDKYLQAFKEANARVVAEGGSALVPKQSFTPGPLQHAAEQLENALQVFVGRVLTM